MKKDLLKTPNVMYDFIYNFVIFLQWIYMIGMGEKPRNMYNTKNKEKFPVWLPSHPPVWGVVSPERGKLGEYV